MSGYEIFKIEFDRTQTDEEIQKILSEQNRKYREWLEQNQNGFVLNVDVSQSSKKYPKLHKASCSWTGEVSKDYFKVCSNNIFELENYSRKYYKPQEEAIHPCQKCNPNLGSISFQTISQQSLESDLDELDQRLEEATTEEAKTQIQRLINARRGQDKFRDSVLELYPRCPISSVDMPELLIASHIKPWRDCSDDERLDPHNGLMLAPHIDALFDSGLITFEKDGSIKPSERLSKENLLRLGITLEEKLEIHPDSEKYFEWHREKIFQP
ncbi:HNH endonuclease [Eikenella sp. S3360]|uniref:HNH endonuclease n=1 Tax=Eikenella glucosivorans TaxID=2766967 RepID=A0ABS0N7S0_9NEIS|nr:HNH endonuclease [Eikenella glucosivorans]MBH5328340.1 HNH endonuclease [Eikenella glucosivorans]